MGHPSTEGRRAVKDVFARYHEAMRLQSKETYAFRELVMAGVERLSSREQEIIRHKYLNPDKVYDYEVYDGLLDPPLSPRAYSKIKRQALSKLQRIYIQMKILYPEERFDYTDDDLRKAPMFSTKEMYDRVRQGRILEVIHVDKHEHERKIVMQDMQTGELVALRSVY